MKERLRQQVLELEAETKKVKELHARLPEGVVSGGICVRRGKEGGGGLRGWGKRGGGLRGWGKRGGGLRGWGKRGGGLRGWGRERWVLFVG